MGEMILAAVSCARGAFTLQVEALRIAPGEKIAILGENGCGKTTLLQALAGLLPTKGSITCGDADWTRLSVEERAGCMAYLPQESGVLFNLSVQELIDLALTGQQPLRGGARAAVLAATEMGDFLRRPYHSLSGGEKQRAMLARVLCRRACLVLLDEPTAPLDMRHAAQVMGHLRASPAAVLAAMHDLNLAVRWFDRFLLMKQGRIIYDMRKDELEAAGLEEIYGLGLKRCNDHFVPAL